MQEARRVSTDSATGLHPQAAAARTAHRRAPDQAGRRHFHACKAFKKTTTHHTTGSLDLKTHRQPLHARRIAELLTKPDAAAARPLIAALYERLRASYIAGGCIHTSRSLPLASCTACNASFYSAKVQTVKTPQTIKKSHKMQPQESFCQQAATASRTTRASDCQRCRQRRSRPR